MKTLDELNEEMKKDGIGLTVIQLKLVSEWMDEWINTDLLGDFNE